MEPRLHHVDILTKDIHTTRDFYETKMGMKATAWFFREDQLEFMFLRDAGATSLFTIEVCGPPLLDWQEQLLRKRGPHADHLSMVADDVDVWFKRLETFGTAFVQPVEPVFGAREFYFYDPGGVILEILSTADPALTPGDPPKPKAALGNEPRLTRVTLLYEDPKDALGYYQDQLGFKRVSRQEVEEAGVYLLADRAVSSGEGPRAPLLELRSALAASADKGKRDSPEPGIYSIGFSVEDLERACEDLAKRGIPVTLAERYGPIARKATIRDPNGVRLEIVQQEGALA